MSGTHRETHFESHSETIGYHQPSHALSVAAVSPATATSISSQLGAMLSLAAATPVAGTSLTLDATGIANLSISAQTPALETAMSIEATEQEFRALAAAAPAAHAAVALQVLANLTVTAQTPAAIAFVELPTLMAAYYDPLAVLTHNFARMPQDSGTVHDIEIETDHIHLESK